MVITLSVLNGESKHYFMSVLSILPVMLDLMKCLPCLQASKIGNVHFC